MAMILLVGTNEAALEGISQTLSAAGRTPRIAGDMMEAREIAAVDRPLLAVVERGYASRSGAGVLGIPLAPGGALILYRSNGEPAAPLPYALQRAVLADLTLPLERSRLVALVQHVEARARATGRGHPPTPPERFAR